MAEGKCIKIIKSAPYLVVMTAGNTICCCHALRGRGSRNLMVFPSYTLHPVTPCEGVGVEIIKRMEEMDWDIVTPCEGVGVEMLSILYQIY